MVLFAGTNGLGILRLTDNGTNWIAVITDLTSNFVHAIAVSPDSSGNIFAGTFSGGVFLSTNAGTNWTAVNTNLTSTIVLTFAIIPGGTSGTNLFTGTIGSGVFQSTDNGTSWTAVNNGLTRTNVSALAVSGTYLFAGTNGSSVFRRPLSDMITSVPTEGGTTDLPTNFGLDQNYPNPFNPTTNFELRIANFGLVKLSAFDLLGHEVAVLVNEGKYAGIYSTTLNATKYPSGVYFYRLAARNFIETKKLLILK